jgi:hypothetical protein
MMYMLVPLPLLLYSIYARALTINLYTAKELHH